MIATFLARLVVAAYWDILDTALAIIDRADTRAADRWNDGCECCPGIVCELHDMEKARWIA